MPAEKRDYFFAKQLRGEEPLSRATATDLLDAARKLAQLQPWDLLSEEQLILVDDDRSGETHCCTIIGTMGESFGLIVFLGREGFSFVRRMQASEGDTGQYLAGNHSLAFEFSSRAELDAPDRDLLKELGYKAAKGDLLPQFRCIRPGYLPWFINEAEGRILSLCARAVVSLLNQDLEKLAEYWPEEDMYPLVTSGGVEIVSRLPEPESIPRPASFDRDRLQRILNRGLRVSGTIEVDFLHLPIPIGDEHERKMTLRLALAADANTGMIYPPEAVRPGANEGDTLASAIVGAVEKAGAIPATIRVRSTRQKAMLALLAESLGAEVKLNKKLDAVDAAKEALLDHLTGE